MAYGDSLWAAAVDELGTKHVLEAIDAALGGVESRASGAMHSRLRSLPSDAPQREGILRAAALDSFLEEMVATDHLLGAAYVVAQASITATTGRIREVHEYARIDGLDVGITDGTSGDIRRFGRAGDMPTRLEVLWAAGNYYKHHDDWPRLWEDASKTAAKGTIAALSRAGITWPTKHETLKKVRSFLGPMEESLATAVYERTIKPWKEAVVGAYTELLTDAGVLAG